MPSRSVMVVAAMLVTCACAGSPSAPTQGARLSLLIRDSPFHDAKAVVVTFSEVTAHTAGGGWAVLPFADAQSSRSCDLKKLQGAQDVLGVGELAAGWYTQLRLVVSDAVLYFDNEATGPACAASIGAPAGQSARVSVPSGEVKLNRPFELTMDGATTIVLDFDGDKSIHQTGNGRYMMTPVIGIVSVQ